MVHDLPKVSCRIRVSPDSNWGGRARSSLPKPRQGTREDPKFLLLQGPCTVLPLTTQVQPKHQLWLPVPERPHSRQCPAASTSPQQRGIVVLLTIQAHAASLLPPPPPGSSGAAPLSLTPRPLLRSLLAVALALPWCAADRSRPTEAGAGVAGRSRARAWLRQHPVGAHLERIADQSSARRLQGRGPNRNR